MSPKVAFEIAELADLTVDQRAAKYEEVHQEKCRSRNRSFIVRRIAWHTGCCRCVNDEFAYHRSSRWQF